MLVFELGDRVAVRRPVPGEPWHTAHGRTYTQECSIGSVGVVERVDPGSKCRVRWESHPSSRQPGNASLIDMTCLEYEHASEEAELEAEARRLFGMEPLPERRSRISQIRTNFERGFAVSDSDIRFLLEEAEKANA